MSRAAIAIPDDPAKALAAADDPRQFVLVALDKAKAWLTTAGSVTDVNDVRAKAEAIRVYTVQAKLGKDSEQAACELRLRAERRVGQLLKPTVQHGGDRKSASRSPSPNLKRLGVTPDESSEFQRLADIPQKRFDDVVSKQRAKQSLSRSALLSEGRAAQEQREYEEAVSNIGVKPLDPIADAAEIEGLRVRKQDIGHLLGTAHDFLKLAERMSGEEFARRYGDDVTMKSVVADASRVLTWLTDFLTTWKEHAA